MLINLFNTVKSSGVPCSLRELLDLIGALEARVAYSDMNDFYYLSRAILVKDEKHYDKFDRAFEIYFKGMEKLEDIFAALIPEDWLRKEFEKQLTEEELKEIKSLGGLEKLLEEFKKRLDEQKERHEGGNKWVGTAGTSPFGNSGNNPEGIRVGGKGGGGNAVKVWEQRQYKNLDDSVLIGTRNIKMALRRLRKFARQSNNMELDMSGTIKNTAKNGGILDINMLPERTNAVKVWEQRQYKNLDDSVLIGTRNIKMALRRLRKFARQSNNMELDMSGTIKNTAKNGGILDINMLPERTNAVKVLIFFDVGGSMDPYVKVCEELFSAVKTELKNLEYFYFHNCIYETAVSYTHLTLPTMIGV